MKNLLLTSLLIGSISAQACPMGIHLKLQKIKSHKFDQCEEIYVYNVAEAYRTTLGYGYSKDFHHEELKASFEESKATYKENLKNCKKSVRERFKWCIQMCNEGDLSSQSSGLYSRRGWAGVESCAQ